MPVLLLSVHSQKNVHFAYISKAAHSILPLEGYGLLIHIYHSRNPKRDNTSRHSMTNIDVAHDRQVWIVNDFDKEPPILIKIPFVHGLPDEYAIDRIKNAALF